MYNKVSIVILLKYNQEAECFPRYLGHSESDEIVSSVCVSGGSWAYFL